MSTAGGLVVESDRISLSGTVSDQVTITSFNPSQAAANADYRLTREDVLAFERSGEFRGRRREFWVWPHERHYIWGATARILKTLADRLGAPWQAEAQGVEVVVQGFSAFRPRMHRQPRRLVDHQHEGVAVEQASDYV